MSADTLQIRPLALMAPQEVADMLRGAGMHPPEKDYRVGLASLLIRADVTVNDAYESADAALRQAAAVLHLVECDEDTDERITGSVSAALHMVLLSRAHLAVLRDGIA